MPRPSQPHAVRRGAATTATGARLNTLGLSHRDLETLLDRLEYNDGPAAESMVRTYIRRRFRHVRIPMQVVQPGGSTATFPVACRNLSRGGVSVLHNAFVHAGTPCTILLPVPARAGVAAGGYVQAHGKVVRCQHRRAMVHEIGVCFDAPIDIRPLLAMDPLADWYSRERLDPTDLKGTLLYIEDSAADRRLIRYFLRETNLTVVTADDAPGGLERARDGVNIILCDWRPRGMPGAAMIETLRMQACKAPVLMLVSDGSEATRDALREIPAQAFLLKPVSQDLMLRAMAEFLLAAPEGAGAAARNATDPAREKAAGQHQRDLHGAASALEAAAKAEDLENCRRLCIDVAAPARAMGMDSLAELAEKTLAQAQKARVVPDIADSIRRLVEAALAVGRAA